MLVPAARSARPRVDFMELGSGYLQRYAVSLDSVLGPYHVGQEFKSGDGGDPTGGGGRGAIDKATTQVLRGRGGFMEHLHNEHKNAGDPARYAPGAIIPVIFTSAKLFTTDSLLEEADPATGEMPKDMKASQQEWLWLDHHMSVGLRTRA